MKGNEINTLYLGGTACRVLSPRRGSGVPAAQRDSMVQTTDGHHAVHAHVPSVSRREQTGGTAAFDLGAGASGMGPRRTFHHALCYYF